MSEPTKDLFIGVVALVLTMAAMLWLVGVSILLFAYVAKAVL